MGIAPTAWDGEGPVAAGGSNDASRMMMGVGWMRERGVVRQWR